MFRIHTQAQSQTAKLWPSISIFQLSLALPESELLHWCRCVEIGCGSGYVICSIARLLAAAGLHCHCIAVDVNPCATECSSRTLQAHQARCYPLSPTTSEPPCLPNMWGIHSTLLPPITHCWQESLMRGCLMVF